MQLYFRPLACSMATRITVYEAGAGDRATFVPVDRHGRLPDGGDLRRLNPLGLVPTLVTDDGEVLTENAAVLQYAAARTDPDLAPAGELPRLQQWLCFVGTELHAGLFAPLLDPAAPEGARAYALRKAGLRLGRLEAHLADREGLLERFSVADAYLFTVLNWAQATPVDLGPFPAVRAWLSRTGERPGVARAVSEELPMYLRELEDRKRSAPT